MDPIPAKRPEAHKLLDCSAWPIPVVFREAHPGSFIAHAPVPVVSNSLSQSSSFHYLDPDKAGIELRTRLLPSNDSTYRDVGRDSGLHD